MSITTTGTVLTFSDGSTMTTVVFPSGTAMLFQQTSAPTGWTKSTTYNDYAIRIVNGTASTGGSVNFSTAFASQAVTGSNSGGAVSASSLSTAQLASHSHSFTVFSASTCYPWCVAATGYQPAPYGTAGTSGAGSGSSHSHGFTNPTFTGTAINLSVKYVDHIIATKN